MSSKKDKKPSEVTQAPKKRKQQIMAPVKPTQENGLTIVGIGASAGGLKALQSFFDALPNETGMAFVVVTHLHPEHESHLAELLQAHTRMPVRQVNGLIPVEVNHVYVIPPNRHIAMADSRIEVSEFEEPRGHRIPIDHFFRSLASGYRNSIAIILSGGGTDGAVGIKAIKEEGGLLMVQHPGEAEYESMPRAAIATGLADVVSPAHELAEKLVQFTQYQPDLPGDAEELGPQQLETLHRILAQVHARTGHDFGQYKRSTVFRRIQRRMQLNGLSTLEAYLDNLRSNPIEARAMFNDILIGVTNFFRDRESWQGLADQAIPAIFREKEAADTVRAWSIGCATGEEAYGTAILLFEHAARMEIRPQIQVFASDPDESSIAQAREGLYPEVIEADVSPERLERFFIRENNHYRVRRELRDVVVFTNHSVLRDAPFSRLDLICCRNVLIYLQREIQDNVFDIFHYALNPGGYLFLGNSESAESAHELFETVDKIHHIYKAKAWNRKHPHIPSLPLATGRPPYADPLNLPRRAQPVHFPDEMLPLADQHHGALEAKAPPSILIDENYAILHISETAGRYLLQPKGPITTDLLKLVRPELQMELRAALFRVFEKGKAILAPPIPVQFNGHSRRVILSIQPHSQAAGTDVSLVDKALVFFLEDEQDEPSAEMAQERDQTRDNEMVTQLEAEVRRLRDQLQASIEEHDSSNEELKASNEELQSLNEEYRSATEELETSKEELQSVNEELQTVNNELKNKLEEISRSHSDLENLMASTEIAMLFLDRELRIRHYTPGMQELFNIMPGDSGRPIRHLTHTLRYSQFIEDAEEVLRTLVPIEHEVRGAKEEWYLLRMRPYRTVDDRIDGVIFTFVDITRLKQADQDLVELNASLEERVVARTRELDEVNQKLSETRDMFRTLFRANPIPTTLNRLEDGVFVDVNEAYLEFFGLKREALIGHTSLELNLVVSPEERAKILERMKVLGNMHNIETQVQTSSGEVKTVLVSSHRINVDNEEVLLSAFIDITSRKQMEENLRGLLDAAPDPTVIVNEAGKIVRINKQLEAAFGYSRAELVGQPVEKLIPQRFHKDHPGHRALFIGEPRARPMGSGLTLNAMRSDGTEFPVEISLSPLETEEGILVIASIRDITERVRADRQIRALATTLTKAEQAERHRISQVLHDDLQQRLFAIRTQLSFLREEHEKKDLQTFQKDIAEMEAALAESISITRNLSINISPIILHGEGLADAIAWLSTRMQEQYGLDVAITTNGTKSNFDESLRVMLFQAVRELLFNVVKHADTLQADVKLESIDDHVRITVSDQGKGFDAEAMMSDNSLANGLLSIRHRLGLMGCSLEVASEPGKGTRATINVPIQDPGS